MTGWFPIPFSLCVFRQRAEAVLMSLTQDPLAVGAGHGPLIPTDHQVNLADEDSRNTIIAWGQRAHLEPTDQGFTFLLNPPRRRRRSVRATAGFWSPEARRRRHDPKGRRRRN